MRPAVRTTKIRSRLLEIMHARKMRVRELVRLAGVGAEAIAGLRNNDLQRFNREVLERICGALNITLDELFVLIEENIWYPIRLHREVTIHLGSNTVPTSPKPSRNVSPEGVLNPEYIGAWDFHAFRVITEHVAKLGRDIAVRSEVHETGIYPGFEVQTGGTLERVFAAGNHIIIGSQTTNQFAEEVVCRLYGVPPFTPTKRDSFPFGFQWDARHGTTPSSFGQPGEGKEFGIYETRTGELVARSSFVTRGEGDDCALIVTHRIWQVPRERRFGRDDERVVVALLGYSGAGTYAGAKIATDARLAASLYPPEHGKPLMRVVAAKYLRTAGDPSRDTRCVCSQRLIDPCAPPSAEPVVTGKNPRVRRGRKSAT